LARGGERKGKMSAHDLFDGAVGGDEKRWA
jgi:hypothetical protein